MDFEKLIAYRNKYNHFGARVGVVLEEVREGYALGRKTVGADDTNPLGYAHGGVYVTLADSVCGSAACAYGHKVVTMSSSYHYYRGACPGDILTAEATALHHGKTTAAFEVKVTDQRGTLLGSGTFTFFVLPDKLELH
ncbi:MAG: PaaI family thioesterase [Oscillibacter sp.]|nr:PaaI family thioesterase [Oscillibacter sp.]